MHSLINFDIGKCPKSNHDSQKNENLTHQIPLCHAKNSSLRTLPTLPHPYPQAIAYWFSVTVVNLQLLHFNMNEIVHCKRFSVCLLLLSIIIVMRFNIVLHILTVHSF